MASSVIQPDPAGPNRAGSPTITTSPESVTDSVVTVLTSEAVNLGDKEGSVPALHQHMESQLNTNALPLVVSLFDGKRDSDPQQREMTWSQLLDRFYKDHSVRKNKDGMLMSPTSYKHGTKRAAENVELVFCAVFDIEHHGPFDVMQEKLKGHAFLAHSSYNHQLDDPRYRIILPLADPIPADQWPRSWAKLNHWLGGINDAATKDASRIYYLPSKPPGAAGHFIESGEGRPVKVEELPELPPDQLAKVSSTTTRNYAKSKIDGIEDAPLDPLSPAEGLGRVVAGCKFMAEVSAPENQQMASRSTWRAMISNASRFEDSDNWIHEASCHHDGYDEKVTDKEIQGCRDFSGGPITCARIQEAGYAGCPSGGCKTVAGNVTKAPAGLWMKGSGMVATSPQSPFISNMPDYVEKFLETNFCGGLVYTNGSFLGYSAGWWRQLDDLADVKNSIARHYGKDAAPKKIETMFSLLQAFLAVAEAVFVPDRRMICLQNGTLNTDTFTLDEHSPEHGLVNKLNIDWNPAASCRTWLKFLDEIFVNDADKAQKITFLKEWFGYCLIPDSSQHKFLWLVGAGGNGKSVLLAILTALVGTKNVSHAHLERLEKGPVRAELEGKLVNISSEMSAEATISDSYFKAIVSGEELEAERKYKTPFSFRPYVRLIGATNHLPRLLDLSDGFFRRAIVLTFNRQFTGAEVDPALESKLLEELPGILTWAMQGLHQLRERGSFDIPQSSITALGQYRQDSDPVATFAEACLDRINQGGEKTSYIYAGYSKWCRLNGFSRRNVIGFGKRLAELGFDSYRTSAGNSWRVAVKAEANDWWDECGMAVNHPTDTGGGQSTTFTPRYRL